MSSYCDTKTGGEVIVIYTSQSIYKIRASNLRYIYRYKTLTEPRLRQLGKIILNLSL